jgi:hypothetical protein
MGKQAICLRWAALLDLVQTGRSGGRDVRSRFRRQAEARDRDAPSRWSRRSTVGARARLSRPVESTSARLARSCGDRLDDVDHRQDEERSPDNRTYLIFLEGGTLCDWLGDYVCHLLTPALQPRLSKFGHRSHLRSWVSPAVSSLLPGAGWPTHSAPVEVRGQTMRRRCTTRPARDFDSQSRQ